MRFGFSWSGETAFAYRRPWSPIKSAAVSTPERHRERPAAAVTGPQTLPSATAILPLCRAMPNSRSTPRQVVPSPDPTRLQLTAHILAIIVELKPSQAFREELLAEVREAPRPEHRGPEVRESAAARAESPLRGEFGRLGWAAEQLVARRKGDPQKPRIAQRLRQETTMTLAWLAARLQMGVPSHLACLLYRGKQKPAREATNENTLF